MHLISSLSASVGSQSFTARFCGLCMAQESAMFMLACLLPVYWGCDIAALKQQQGNSHLLRTKVGKCKRLPDDDALGAV